MLLPPNFPKGTEMSEMTKDQLLDRVYDLQHKLEKAEAKFEASEREKASFKQTIVQITKRQNETQIGNEITRSAMAVGIIPDGIPDIIGAAIRDGWAVNDRGEMELRDPKTGAVAFDVTPESWAAAQAKGQRKYLFQSGQQPGGGGFSAVKNPWSREHWNATEQGKVYREQGAERAKAMAEAAGSSLDALKPK
jgi:flagellar hook-basal body complex protein FliE